MKTKKKTFYLIYLTQRYGKNFNYASFYEKILSIFYC